MAKKYEANRAFLENALRACSGACLLAVFVQVAS